LFGFALQRVFNAELKMTESQQLLAEYVRSGSEAAFRELVARYLNLVYSAAVRLVEGDAHRAEDVAQTVFADLARQARTFSQDTRLGGWLHRHTCFVAANTMRGERRRQSRERQAVEMNALQDQPEANLSLIAPILDDAINQLGDADRTAILLRFFEQRDFRSVGEALGSNEDAARMRVTRALEKLELLLKRRGVTAGSAALAVMLGAHAVQAAPAGLIASISATALSGTAVAATAAATVTKAIAMTTLQKALITSTILAAVGTEIFQMHRASEMREQLQTLWQQQAPLNEQVRDLQRQRDEATNRLALFETEMAGIKSNSAGQLKLRGEVTRLQKDSQELAQLKAKVSRRDDMDAARMRSFREYQEWEAILELRRMKEAVKLTPAQEQALQDLFDKRTDLIVQEMQAYNAGTQKEFEGQFSQSMSNVSAQIDAVISPEQQSDYKALQQRGAASMARLFADGELTMMQKLVGISPEQEDQIYPILVNYAPKTGADNTSDVAEKANALAAVLTPAQMDQYRKYMQGKKVTTQISYPQAQE
jgi:RNA polymerase sigma factor (sigma-70 family)